MTAQQKLNAKVASQSTASLKKIATAMNSDIRDESSIVLSAALDALMARLPEAEFVSFCSELEAV